MQVKRIDISSAAHERNVSTTLAEMQEVDLLDQSKLPIVGERGIATNDKT